VQSNVLRHYAVPLVPIALALLSSAPLPVSGASPYERIISQPMARRHGLERMWVTRVELDPSRGRVADVLIDGGELFVLTTRGLVHALNAESGRTLWTARVGRRDFPSTSPAVNKDYVALTNGSTLYVLSRRSGLPVFDVSVGGSPSAGPAVGENWVCVPLSNGIVEAYHLADRDRDRLIHAAAGIPEIAPLATPQSVVCATKSGWIYSCVPETMAARFRIETTGAITAPMSYVAPHIIAASRDGYVYAFHETEGDDIWRFSAGEAVSRRPVVIGDAIYVIPELGGLYQISAALGVERWHAAGVDHFLAASPTKVYAADRLGRTVVLDVKTGVRLDWLPTEALSVKPANTVTDRIYLGSSDGLLQCLREIELREPVRYDLPPQDGEPPMGDAPDAGPPAAPPADAVPAAPPAEGDIFADPPDFG